MQSRVGLLSSFAVAWSLVGCASSAEARPSPKGPTTGAGLSPSNGVSPPVRVGFSSPSPSAQAASDAPPPKPSPDANTGQVPRSLPELRLTLSGMHIGGGPNDAVTKRPFIEAIENGFDAMRACYLDAVEPEKGGTFGVDLRVERAGGRPVLQSVRTAMKGDRFKTCLERAFTGLEFGRPAKGPTVISVSILFSLES